MLLESLILDMSIVDSNSSLYPAVLIFVGLRCYKWDILAHNLWCTTCEKSQSHIYIVWDDSAISTKPVKHKNEVRSTLRSIQEDRPFWSKRIICCEWCVHGNGVHICNNSKKASICCCTVCQQCINFDSSTFAFWQNFPKVKSHFCWWSACSWVPWKRQG